MGGMRHAGRQRHVRANGWGVARGNAQWQQQKAETRQQQAWHLFDLCARRQQRLQPLLRQLLGQKVSLPGQVQRLRCAGKRRVINDGHTARSYKSAQRAWPLTSDCPLLTPSS